MKKVFNREFLYHTIFWLFYDLQSTLSHPAEYIEQYGFWSIALKQTTSLIVLIIPFYISFFLLIPRYLKPKKYLKFYISEAILIIFGIGLLYFESVALDWYFNMEEFFTKDFVAYLPYFTSRIFFFLVISVGSKFTIDWFKYQKRITQLEKENREAELKMLKYQISPHFLFNSLNNVYSLILSKSDKAETLFIKFSNLLRYQLSKDIHSDLIPLEKEVSYIRDFIELQKIRLIKTEIVDFQVFGDIANKSIPPLLIIPFVENAFKHGDISEDSEIQFKLSVDNNSLIFESSNQIKHKEKDITSGIGIANVKRRLELLYSGKYSLKIEETASSFSVILILENI